MLKTNVSKINFPRNDKIIMIILSVFFLALMIGLSYFANPFRDESFPFAITLRFIHGQKPFVDDLSPYINLGILLYPLVKLSLIVHQGKNELILFLRHAFVIFNILIGLYTFFATKKYLPLLLAFFTASMVAIYHPFGINNFHYDTLATALWTVIVFQLVNFLSTPILKTNHRFRDYLLFSGLNLLLCMAYQTFALLLLTVYLACTFFLADRKKFWLSHFLVLLCAGSFMCWLIFQYFGIQFSDIKNTLRFSQNVFQASAKQNIFFKLILVSQTMAIAYKNYVLTTLAVIASAYLLRKIKWLAIILFASALSIPLFNISLKTAAYSESFYFLNCMGFLAPIIFLFFLRHNSLAKKMFYVIWVPSLCAGLLTSITSSNSTLNFNLGFFPASLLAFIYAYLAVLEICKQPNIANYIATRSVLLYGCASIVFFQTNYIYDMRTMGPALYIDAQQFTEDGPFKGLYLESAWISKIAELQKDIKKIDVDKNNFIYFGEFSSGYLLVDNLKPGDYFLFCIYRFNHWGEKPRLPNYTVDASRALQAPGKDINIYLSGASYTKIMTATYHDIYRGV